MEHCQTGIDYDECTNMVEKAGDYCEECREKQYDNYIESLVEGFGVKKK